MEIVRGIFRLVLWVLVVPPVDTSGIMTPFDLRRVTEEVSYLPVIWTWTFIRDPQFFIRPVTPFVQIVMSITSCILEFKKVGSISLFKIMRLILVINSWRLPFEFTFELLYPTWWKLATQPRRSFRPLSSANIVNSLISFWGGPWSRRSYMLILTLHPSFFSPQILSLTEWLPVMTFSP